MEIAQPEFQEIVYRGHGPHQRPGGTFGTLGVRSEKDYDAALNDGWFKTLPEAIDANDNPGKPKAQAVVVEPVVEAPVKAEDISPEPVKESPEIEHVAVIESAPIESNEPVIESEVAPEPAVLIDEIAVVTAPLTGEALKQKARDLGITVHHRHSDAKLLELIAEATK